MEKNIEKVVEILDREMWYKEVDVWIIKYKGKRIQTHSGKSSWNLPGHAKSAFTNMLYGIVPFEVRRELGFRNNKDLSQYLFEKGIVTVERL